MTLMFLIFAGTSSFTPVEIHGEEPAEIRADFGSAAVVDVLSNAVPTVKKLHLPVFLFFVEENTVCDVAIVSSRPEKRSSADKIFRNKYLKTLLLKAEVL